MSLPTNGLCGYWPLAGDLKDTITGRELTNHGLTFESDPLYGTVVVADGNSYASGTMAANYPISSFSYACLVKMLSDNSGRVTHCLGRDATWKAAGFTFTGVNLAMERGSGLVDSGLPIAPDGRWHCCLVSVSGTTATFYLDDSAGSPVAVSGFSFDRPDFAVGSFAGGLSRFSGNLAHLLVYNRALDGTEIAAVRDYLVNYTPPVPEPTRLNLALRPAGALPQAGDPGVIINGMFIPLAPTTT